MNVYAKEDVYSCLRSMSFLFVVPLDLQVGNLLGQAQIITEATENPNQS